MEGALIRDYSESTVTPEAVQLHADVAGIGSRTIALLVDLLIQGALLVPVVLVIAADGVSGVGATIVVIVVLFLVLWFYFPAFEWLWRGQTPGKRFQGIRVVRTNGQPAGFAPVVVRNLVRIVDVMLLPFVALISMVVTRRSQRLGDLAAGTMVIRERGLPVPTDLSLRSASDALAPALDTTGFTERDYTVMRTFLARRSSLDLHARQQLAARLAARIRERLPDRPGDPIVTDEQLIEAVAWAYRSRFSDREG